MYPRAEWAQLGKDEPRQVTAAEIQHLRSLNDVISLDDVAEVYMPLVQYILMRAHSFTQSIRDRAAFLNVPAKHTPFIIGISGSVAVGKSTTARLLQLLLSRTLPEDKVQMITTDGFLLPNAELERRGISGRKGFPESYDMARLTQFLVDVKADKTVNAPLYSHQLYDVVPDAHETVAAPDILIVEGINVLQMGSASPIYYSDLYDLTLYVDAEAENIERWYLERFGELLDRAADNPDDYYYRLARGEREAAMTMAKGVWQRVNLPNLEDYILPTRDRASVILHKTADHSIDQVALRAF
nr:type I pantothenate kinase [Lacticaseibacillus zhaodongensis]